MELFPVTTTGRLVPCKARAATPLKPASHHERTMWPMRTRMFWTLVIASGGGGGDPLGTKELVFIEVELHLFCKLLIRKAITRIYENPFGPCCI